MSGPNRSKTRRRIPLPANHINIFLVEHPSFDYDPSAPVWTEFNRMCDEFEWDTKRKFKSAVVQQFNNLYGSGVEDLHSWQNLCHVLNIKSVPDRLKECREQVRQTHVNLVDLVDTPRTGASVRVFPNLEKLRDYTSKNEKYFPKEDAYAGGLLRFLLREILHSYVG
ncbi:hypothetical protein BJ875DRAFT_502020 [Amylocarpus encephaloides]|uniref:Uncharacterized protein n=1 Tax=Amylocarpus encephaloides TaxID=45428 RepID=A0A9P7YR88_9HELO|nr:hypothetical protein BJ875DRAFT_502020 [Amylocarpus encephaloides]